MTQSGSVNASLLDARRAQIVACTERAVIDHEFRHEKSEMPFVPAGASGRRASTKYDVVRHIVLAISDEDLLALEDTCRWPPSRVVKPDIRAPAAR